MSDKICVIFGAGNEFPESITLPENSLVIAADGGLKKLTDLGITPDIIVGDFDSLGHIPTSANTVTLPHEKDTTDMKEAVGIGIKNGCSEFHIYGGTGGRLDHTLANIQLAAEISTSGKKVVMYGKNYAVTAVTNGSVRLPARDSGYVSVFAHSDICTDVTIHGLYYETENITLSSTFALGVSNEFVGKAPEICVGNGTLIIYYEMR